MSLPFHGLRRQHDSPVAAPTTPELSEETLVSRLAHGDAAAFETLFHRYYAELCGFAHRCVGSADTAEDLVQEILLYTWKQRAVLDVRTSVRAYLYAAVRNAAASHLRHARVVERREGEVVSLFDRAPAQPDRLLATSEATAELQRALAKLPERCRLIFTLQREQGLTYAQVADTLGISPKTVDVQMGRALKRLRRLLGPNWP